MNDAITARKQRHDGRVVLWWVLGFFLTFMVVDAVMVTVAVTTQTGTVTDQPYEKGLAYNKTISAAREQEKLGWRATFSYDAKLGAVQVRLVDRVGAMIDGAQVSAQILRRVHDGDDRALSLVEKGTGVYMAVLDTPLARGVWMAEFHVTKDSKDYQFTEQFMVP